MKHRSKVEKSREERYKPYMKRTCGHYVDQRHLKWFKEQVRQAALVTRQQSTPEEWFSIRDNEDYARAMMTPILEDEA